MITILPGFVRTRMTKGMALPSVLTAEAKQVAEAIFRAVVEKPREVVYVKPVWLVIMVAHQSPSGNDFHEASNLDHALEVPR